MALTPHVGVRTILQGVEAQPLIIADMSTIGGAFTAPDLDTDSFAHDEPFAFFTNDAAAIEAIGATGTLAETIAACTAEGIVAQIVATVPDEEWDNPALPLADQMAAICGSANSKTGLWSLLDSLDKTGVEPDLLIAPGYTSQRLGTPAAANPAATIIDALCNHIVTAVGICDAPSTNKTDAAAWAADFDTSMNLIAIGQGVRVFSGASVINRPASPSIAALIAKTDKEKGAPYYNPGNRALTGILGPTRTVDFRISDPDSEANWLIQRGVNSLVQVQRGRTALAANGPQGKTFWGFFNTCSDPLWRAINVVRTRKAVREVIPRTLVKYAGRNLSSHLVTVLCQSVDDFIGQLMALPEPAVLGGEVKWERALNSNPQLRTGSLAITLNFEEAPPVTDIVVYTGRYERAFDILANEITAAMAQFNVTGELAA
jgi:phage tail sheath protein FI